MSQEPNALNDQELEDVTGGVARLNTPKPTTADIRARRIAESNYAQADNSSVARSPRKIISIDED